MTERLYLSPKHRVVIEALLREHLPGVEVWAYGSRVDGRSHEGSDLDLVLRGPGLEEIPIGQLGDFEEAIWNSAIPFLVEARDWAGLPERFHREIERGYVVLVGDSGGPFDGPKAGEWLTVRFGLLLTEPVRNGIYKGKAFHGRGAKIVNMGELFAHPRLRAVPMKRVELSESEAERFLIAAGDLLFARRSLVAEGAGKCCVVLDADEPTTFESSIIRARPDSTKADSLYLYYFFNSSLGLYHLDTIRRQVAVAGITGSDLAKLEISVPPLSEQRAIAHILGTLDDKIELNRRMNETLEAMARALFKSWFVDFDPVRAKAAFRNHATLEEESPKQGRGPEEITPPLRGSRGDKDASPQASRWGESGATQPPRPWPDIKRQYAPKTLQHAQTLRQNQTNAEGLLWHYLRNKQLGGYKFRRQQPIGPYIADFACLPEKLLIELDGGQHANPNAPDEQRDRFLRQQGYRVLRFWNHEVFADCFGVLESIYAALTHHPPLEGGSKDASLSGRGSPPPHQPAPDGLASATPPQGGSDWSVDRARAYLDSMDPEIAVLFPDRFVDSELGEIPTGWKVGVLGDVLRQRVERCRASEETALLPYVPIDCISPRSLSLTESKTGVEAKSSLTKFYAGDLLFGAMRPYYHKVCIAPFDGTTRTTAFVLHPKRENDFSFAALLLHDAATIDFATRNSTGSTIPYAVWSGSLEEMTITLPASSVLNVFDKIVRPLLMRVIQPYFESRALAALRDALLPKLVSGELQANRLMASGMAL